MQSTVTSSIVTSSNASSCNTPYFLEVKWTVREKRALERLWNAWLDSVFVQFASTSAYLPSFFLFFVDAEMEKGMQIECWSLSNGFEMPREYKARYYEHRQVTGLEFLMGFLRGRWEGPPVFFIIQGGKILMNFL